MNDKLNKIPKSIILIIALSICALFALWAFLLRGIISDIETLTYDWRAKIATEHSPLGISQSRHDPEIILLAADDKSTRLFENYPEINPGRWPWSRNVWGDVVNFIDRGKPRAIVFDLKFEGYSHDAQVDRTADKYFADSIKEKNVIIATALSEPGNSQKIEKLVELIDKGQQEKGKSIQDVANDDVDKAIALLYTDVFRKNSFDTRLALKPDYDYSRALAYDEADTDGYIRNITFYQSTPIYSELTQNAKYLGVINLKQSENTVFRRHVPLYRLVHSGGISYIPSLPLAAVLSVLPEKEKKPFIIDKNSLILGKRVIPMDNSGSILLNWHGKGGTYENIPVANVILSAALEKSRIKELKDFEKISPDFFRNKIVVIGQTSAGTDIHPTPMSSVYPGPEIIATAIDNLLNDTNATNPNKRDFIKKPPLSVEVLLVFSLCFIIGYAMIKIKSNVFKFYIFVLSILTFVIIAISLFVQPQARIWLNMTYPIIFMVGTGIGSYIYMSWRDASSRKHIENMFGRFVSPQILEKLLSEKKEISLEGQRKVMTVLFSDIRGFTSLSEMNSPDDVINTLNEYLSEMVEIILSYNGTLDKFIGDAIMAFYNDPVEMEDHALRAVQTALAMKQRLAEINKRWFAQGKPFFNIGIGINTGDMIVGQVGSSRLVDYTVIGDNVNLASRIEGLTKEYKVTILISESTYEEVKDRVETRYIDEVRVKGRETPVKIYEVLDLK